MFILFYKAFSDSSLQIAMVRNSFSFLDADTAVWSCLQLRKPVY